MTTILTLLPLSLFLYILYTAVRGQRVARPVAVEIKTEPSADTPREFQGVFTPLPHGFPRT